MKIATKLILFTFFLLSLTGCSSVISNRPIGLDCILVNPEEWNGIWLIDDNVVRIKVIDDTNGIVKIASIEDKNNDLKLESIVLKVMKGEKWLYANIIEMEGEKATDKYLWGRISKEERKIIFWAPSVKEFAKAAESKKIDATVSKKTKSKGCNEISEEEEYPDNVILKDEPKTIIDLIENGESNYFEWDHPIILSKLI